MKRLLFLTLALAIGLVPMGLWAQPNSQVGGEPTAQPWKVFPAGAGVSFADADGHILKLGDIAIDKSILLEGKGASLEISYRVAHNSQRRILAWTDVSGPADIAFTTTENLVANKVAVSKMLPSGTDFVSIPLPKEMLADTRSGKVLTEVYVLLCVDKGEIGQGDAYTDIATNQRGGSRRNGVNGVDLAKELDIFDSVKLNIDYSEFISRISLTPGSDETMMNFAWFTEKDSAKSAIVQLAKAEELGNADMPAHATAFNGSVAKGTRDFDTNRVTVTGLLSETEYAYRVGDGNQWSPVYNFTTGNPHGRYNVIATADPQMGNAREAEAWRSTLEKAVAKAGHASFILNAGDLGDKSNSMEQYGWVTAPRVLRSLPFATAIGNHDTFDFLGPPHEQIGLMPIHFNWPNHTDLKVGEGDKPFMRAGGDYYFNYGSTLYIVLNSNVKNVEIHRPFMKKAVASNPNAKWIVALLHHDIYGTGDHAGTAYQDAQKMQPTWSPFLDEFGVDIAINGHDHVYARSLFMQGNKEQREQMPAKMDPLGINIKEKNPGSYVLPKGILYMALSASACEKMYAPEYQDWVAYTHGMLGVPEYSIMTIDGDTLTFTSYRSDTDEATDSITLRKKASAEDLETLLADAQAIPQSINIVSGWDEFLTAFERAKTALETSGDIHGAYVDLYQAYYAISLNTDKTKLSSLIAEVQQTLEEASEGLWTGQYPEGSKAVLNKAVDEYALVLVNKMATQVETDRAQASLQEKLNAFRASVSAVDIPWSAQHRIKGEGVNKVELLGWMAGDVQHAYVVKQEFAKDNLGGKRSSPADGPANKLGGRGPSESHITKTHIGEWIRYELNIEKAGWYRAALGVANESGTEQKILLRNMANDSLCAFNIPADARLPAAGWSEAAMVEADREIYLPKGRWVLELYFVNNGVGVSVSSGANVAFPNDAGNVAYPDGPDVDILTLVYVRDGKAPTLAQDPNIYALPLPPTSIQGAPARQKGWASEGYVDDQGNVSKGISLDVFMAAKTLVLELAARPASTNIQLHLIPEGNGSTWAANETTPNNTPALVMNTLYRDGKLVFPLDEMLGYEAWSKSKVKCMLDISYYSYGWDDMNVMKAYFILDPALMSDELKAAQEKAATATASADEAASDEEPAAATASDEVAVAEPAAEPAEEKPASRRATKLLTTRGLLSRVPPKPEAGEDLEYQVQKDEELWSVVFNYYASRSDDVIADLWDANADYLQSTNGKLEAGKLLRLPAAGLVDPITRGSVENMAGVYLVKWGDTLAGLARTFYGNASSWRKIYDANTEHIKLVNGIPMIYEKQWIIIPE